MKKVLSLLAMATLAIVACNKEKESKVEDGSVFPGDEDSILIEVTVPEGTSANDVIYLAGAVTGNQDNAAAFKLSRSSRGGNVLAAYLDPDDFIGGKTLADPFWFVSKEKGIEVDASGNAATHTISDAKKGKAYSVKVVAWKGKGGDQPGGGDEPGGDTPGGDEPGGDEPGGGDQPGGDTPQPQDGAALVYVYDVSGFGDMWLYAWEGEGTVTGTPNFPGVQNEGTQTISGHSFYKFTLGAAYLGSQKNFIFDDGSPADGKQTDNTPLTFTAGQVRYFSAPWGLQAVEISDPATFNPGGDNPGGGDQPGGDDPQPGLEVWSLYGNIGGGGDNWSDHDMTKMEGEETWHIEFTYNPGEEFKIRKNHDFEKGDYGLNEPVVMPISADVYLVAGGGNIILSGAASGTYDLWFHPNDGNAYLWVQIKGGGGGDPQPGTGSAKLYVYDAHGWGGGMHLWAWKDTNTGLCGDTWPGNKTPSGTETVDGKEFRVFDLDSSFMGEIFFLFCNGDGTAQTYDYGPVTIADGGKYYYNIVGNGIEQYTPGGGNQGGDSTVSDWTIVGEANDWNAATGTSMYIEGNASVAKSFVVTEGANKLKFVKNGTWSINLGYGPHNTDNDISADMDLELTYDGGNLVVPAGKYNVYLDPSIPAARFVKVNN